ncbi:MAG: hypothetical protein Q8P15_01930 [Nanoarchaeota archaeon]|nr:hypothetical protein [Nanoarchaeota archaeon]
MVKRKKEEHANGLRKAWGAMSVIGILGGIIFLSPAFTGRVIGNFTNSTASTWTGGILFCLGIVGAFFYFRKK